MASSPSPIRIIVNGRSHEVRADPDTPLLYVLRNDLELNAAKYGCGLGRCGACAVHIDGELALSCLVTLGEAGDRPVLTLEGLGDAGNLHPLQQAFLDEQAAQCGYCIPGIIMSAAAYLEATPEPTEAGIRHALAGALCRCGAHDRILRAIRRVAGVDVASGEGRS